MQKAARLFALAVVLVASGLDLRAGSLAGVILPDTVQVAGTTLLLNGLGLRKKFVVKVYVAGLYLEQKTSDCNAILTAAGPKRIVLHFLHSVSKTQLVDAFEESFSNNAPDARRTMKSEIDQLLGALEPVNNGDEMVFTYVPGSGVILSVNEKEKLTIGASAFAPVIFSLWLGPRPPSSDLKKGILGQ